MASGVFQGGHREDFRFYPSLSAVWRQDLGGLNLRKSLTCSLCGTGFYGHYYCPDLTCHYGLCFHCYARRRWPGEPTNYPAIGDHALPLPGPTCARSLAHKPVPGQPDLSFVLIPVVHLQVCGFGAEEERRQRSLRQMTELDQCLQPGLGYYPFEIKYKKNLAPGPATHSVTQMADTIKRVHADALIIQINAHMGQNGYDVGGGTYSANQLVATFIRPVVRAFRSTLGRSGSSRVLVLFNVCDTKASTWTDVVDQEPAAQAFDLITFRNPLLLQDVPSIMSGFIRAWLNRLNWQEGFHTGHALASAVTWQFERGAQPVLFRRGHAPITDFLIPYCIFLLSRAHAPLRFSKAFAAVGPAIAPLLQALFTPPPAQPLSSPPVASGAPAASAASSAAAAAASAPSNAMELCSPSASGPAASLFLALSSSSSAARSHPSPAGSFVTVASPPAFFGAPPLSSRPLVRSQWSTALRDKVIIRRIWRMSEQQRQAYGLQFAQRTHQLVHSCNLLLAEVAGDAEVAPFREGASFDKLRRQLWDWSSVHQTFFFKSKGPTPRCVADAELDSVASSSVPAALMRHPLATSPPITAASSADATPSASARSS